MSTFRGRLHELENVLVDNFLLYKSHTCFFLSHCHSDHMSGLDHLFASHSDSSDEHLYCSPISRLILLKKYSSADENFIKEITEPTVITVPGNSFAPSYKVTVTPIPAGHCPGSIMFLFEAVNTSILYTGDFRIFKNDISKFKSLHSKSSVKCIDKVYFDSTFLNDLFWEFPSRSEVVIELSNLIVNWVKNSLNYHILLETSALYGYEYILVELARKLKCKIHVKDFLHDLFKEVPEVGTFLTKDCSSTKIHAMGMFDKKCVSPHNKKLLRIRLSAQWYKHSKGSKEKKKIWKEISKGKILMCYSTHCSCSELVEFLNYLQPKSLHPCCVAVGSTEENTKLYIERLMASWPSQKIKNSEPLEKEFPLEKNYKFKLVFPKCETNSMEEILTLSTEKNEFFDVENKNTMISKTLTDT